MITRKRFEIILLISLAVVALSVMIAGAIIADTETGPYEVRHDCK